MYEFDIINYNIFLYNKFLINMNKKKWRIYMVLYQKTKISI